nr:MAG TPA: hypothetical protein [Caudoviricetes sp.]
MREIKIDFDNPGLPQRLNVVENDAQSRFFKAVLYKDGKAYAAPSGATYSIMYRGFGPQNEGWYDTINDGAGKRAACSVSGNVVTCEIARQALRVPGHVSVVLCVTGSNGYMLHGWPIDCNCRNDSYTSGTSVESFFYITHVTNADWNSAIQTWEELKNMIDPTLSLSGKAADAAKVGEAINAEATRAKAAEEENAKGVSQLTEDLRNENLFVKQSAVIGVRLAANGTTVDAEKYFTSDYIPIERLLNYKKNSPLSNVYHRMCVYNTAKKYIKNIDNTNDLYNENGAYVRFCGLLTEIDEAKFIQCNAYDSISRLENKKNNESYASFEEEVFNNIGYYKKSNDYKVTLNSGWSATGVLLYSGIYNAVEISVKDGEKIAFAGSFGENAVCLEVLYDGALKNRIKISGDFNAPNLFCHKVSNGVTKILLSVRNQNNAGYKFKFEYFKNSIFDSTKRILSQAQFIGQKFYSTAHQGYIGYGSKENTLQAFIDACECGKFNCIETDARLTKDNIFVLSHDASIVDSGITYVIKEKTYEELKKVFTDICTLEECMKICKKYGVYLLIDKLIDATIEENSQYLFPIIRKYRMQDTVLFSSAVSREGWTRKILEFNPKAKIAFYYPNEWFTAEQLAKAKNYVDGKNEIIITCSNTAITEENLQLFYDNCDGVKIGTSVQNNLELYKSLFYTMDYIDSNKYGVIDCFYN